MKRILLLCLLLALLCTGCSKPGAADRHPDWDTAWFRVSEDLGVETPAGFALNESNDVMSIAGLYYATWTTGEGRDIVNAQGREATVYDAQIYVLVKLHDSVKAAEADLADWMSREADAYETGEETAMTAAGQIFRILPLLKAGADNPYAHGIAAFAIHGTDAITVELLCADGWQGDPEATLEAFLNGFHYGN